MKRFLAKTAWFVVPAFILMGLTKLLYSADKGDQLRMSYLADTYNYDHNELFPTDFGRKKNFTRLTELDLNKQYAFKYVIIGDSFSDQNEVSYFNYLAENDTTSVLWVDRYINDNPLETLQGIINSGILRNIKAEYVVLESVERDFVTRRTFDKQKVITADTIQLRKKEFEANNERLAHENAAKDELFINRNLKFLRSNALYLFDDNAFYNDTHHVTTNEKLFSVDKPRMLFFGYDLGAFEENSNQDNINALNNELNLLVKKLTACCGAKLLVLPAPDKFSMYYPYISNKSDYRYSGFFEKLGKLEKSYLYIDSKAVLSEMIKSGIKDVYYFDDSHWSPLAARRIAEEILNTQKN